MRELKTGRKTRPRRSGVKSRENHSTREALAPLAQEIAVYKAHQPRLLREHAGQFVLIKADQIVGVFPDRSSALDEGYRRFGIVSFLVREISETQPVIYLPNVVP